MIGERFVTICSWEIELSFFCLLLGIILFFCLFVSVVGSLLGSNGTILYVLFFVFEVLLFTNSCHKSSFLLLFVSWWFGWC